MMINNLKTKILNKEEVIGIWSLIPSPSVVEIIMSTNLDFIILDMEHGSFDHNYIENSIRSVEVNNKCALVRIPNLNPQLFQSALDLGAQGVIVPKIESKVEAELVVKYSNYYPKGTRGFNPFTRAHKFYSGNKHTPVDPLNSILIENIEGLNNLEKICDTEDLNVIYIGSYDLSLNLGYNGNTHNKDLLLTIEKAASRIVKLNKTCGLMIGSKEDMAFARNIGAKFLTFMVDSYQIQKGINESLKKIKNI